MASIAEQLIGTVAQGAQNTGSNLKAGADLAQGILAVQDRRAQLEQQKEEAEAKKLQQVASWYDTGAKMDPGPARKAFMNNFIPQGIAALKLKTPINPTVTEMLNAEPLLAARLVDDIRTGKTSVAALSDPAEVAKMAQGLKQYGDAKTFQDTVQEYLPTIQEAGKFAASEEGKGYRAKMVADAAAGRQEKQIASVPETEYKKKVADVAANYNTQGGAAGVAKNVAKMRGVIESLKNGSIKLGTLAKNIPYGSTEEALARLDPKAKAAMDDVRGAINLRAALADPNPTAMQVNSIMSRAFDPRLSNDANIKKLEEAIVELETAAKDREKEFVKYGFAQKSAAPPPGSDGRNWLSSQSTGYKKLPQDQQMKFIQGAAKKFNLTPAEVKKALGIK